MTRSNRPYLAVRAIIPDSCGKVLILKRDHSVYGNEEWCLPGGNIEYGETAIQAVAMEVEEETSLICKQIKFLFYMDNLPGQGLDLHYVTLYFLCTAEGALQLNNESSEYAWIGPGETGKYKIAFGNEKALKRYWEKES